MCFILAIICLYSSIPVYSIYGFCHSRANEPNSGPPNDMLGCIRVSSPGTGLIILWVGSISHQLRISRSYKERRHCRLQKSHPMSVIKFKMYGKSHLLFSGHQSDSSRTGFWGSFHVPSKIILIFLDPMPGWGLQVKTLWK
jgi:hypothetical protein